MKLFSLLLIFLCNNLFAHNLPFYCDNHQYQASCHGYFAPSESSGRFRGSIDIPSILRGIVGFFKYSNKTPHESWHCKDYERYFKKNFGNYEQDPYKQRQILQQHDLYQYYDFCEFILTLPEAAAYLDQFHRSNTDRLCFTANPREFDQHYFYVYKLVDILDQRKKEREDAARSSHQPKPLQKQAIIKPQQNQNKSVEHLENRITSQLESLQCYLTYEPAISNSDHMIHVQRRDNAIALMIQKRETYSIKDYELSTNVQELLIKRALPISEYKQCYGNELQQAIHQEIITVFERASTHHEMPHRAPLLFDCITDSAHTAHEYNHNGLVITAIDVIEIAWTLLDYDKAIIEGIAEVVSDIDQAIKHPIVATHEMCRYLYDSCYAMSKVVLTLMKYDTACSHPQLYSDQRKKEIEEKFGLVLQIIEDQYKQTPTRDKIKSSSKLVTQTMVSNQLLKSIGALFKGTVAKLPIYFVRLRQSNRTAAIAEHIETAVAVQTAEIINTTIQAGATEVTTAERAVAIINTIEHSCTIVTRLEQLLAPIEAEIATLAKLFDNTCKGFAEFAHKFIKLPYKHIVSMEFNIGKKGIIKFSGFHHDFHGLIENSGLVQFVDKKIFKDGFYSADIMWMGKRCPKTFFPRHWPREKVMSKILEAYENFIKDGAKNFKLKPDGKYAIKGYTDEGVLIEMHITKSGHITTAYPFLE